MAMLIIAMFLFSGISFAKQEGEPGSGEAQGLGLANAQMERLDLGGFREANKERLQEFRQGLPEKREVAKQKLEQARERYMNVKEKYLELKERFMNQKQNFLEAKNRYLECKNNEDTECEQVRSETRERAREHLLDSADLILNHIETIKEKIESSEDLSEEEISDLLAKLEEQKNIIEEAKSTIEALDENSSNDDIKEAAKTIREAWQNIKVGFKHSIGRTVGARLRNVIANAQEAGERLSTSIDALEAEGQDVSDIKDKLNQYNLKVEEAITKYEEASAKWEETTTPGEVDELAKEANALFKEANELIKEAHGLMKEIVKDIKDKGSEIISDEEENEE